MARDFFIAFVLILASHVAEAQVVQVSRAIKYLEKEDFEKVEKLLAKADSKDSSAAPLYYGRGRLFIDSAYSHYDLDSAHYYQKLSQLQLDSTSADEKSKYDKIPFGQKELDKLLKRINTIGFTRAIQQNSEHAYQAFLDQFDATGFEEEVIRRRDSLAFKSVVFENTYQAYKKFMDKYPDAREFRQAKERYERLFFSKSTSDGKLSSYRDFLNVHPRTVYRKEAERNIFYLSTANGESESYKQFINDYPRSEFADKANRYLYHLDKSMAILSDSLEKVEQMNRKGILYPTFELGTYSFFDNGGDKVLKTKAKNLNETYLCEGMISDFFSTNSSIIARNGATIYDQKHMEVTDLGSGILMIETSSGNVLYHKSGHPVTKDRYDDAKLVANRFIAVKEKKLWGLIALNGMTLTKPKFDEIISQGQFVLLEKDGMYDVTNVATISKLADNRKLIFNPLFIEYQLLLDDRLWLRTSKGETVFNADLKEIIPYANQSIELNDMGYLIEKDHSVTLLDQHFTDQLEVNGDSITVGKNFIKCKVGDKWQLTHVSALLNGSLYDSVTLAAEQLAIGYRKDSIHFFFLKRVLSLPNSVIKSYRLIQESKSLPLLKLELVKQKPRYYNVHGALILSGHYDEVVPAGSEYVIVSESGKKGLYDSSGIQLLKPLYDAVAGYNEGNMSYLKNKKFGLVNAGMGVVIPPEYDRNIRQYSDSLFVGFKNRSALFIDIEGNEIDHEPVEEIHRWTDSVAIVKQDFNYHFVTSGTSFTLSDQYKSYTLIEGNTGEKFAIVRGDQGYGVVSSKNGVIISPTFNDIINIGTLDEPFFFTEKHVEEAEFYVVIYYNKKGELIYKRAYEGKDYPKIYCDN